MDATTRAGVLALVNDVAQSEHRLRHKAAFEAMVAALGLETVHEPHVSSVREPAAKARVKKAKA